MMESKRDRIVSEHYAKLWRASPRFMLAVLLLWGSSQAFAQPAELPAGYRVSLMTTDNPPANMAKKGGNVFARGDEIEGYATDAVREMFKRAGIEYDIVLRNPWEREQQMVKKTPNSGLFAFAQTEPRKADYKWVGPLGHSDTVLVAGPGKTIEIGALKDIAQYRVGAAKGDSVVGFLEKLGIAYQPTLNDHESLTELAHGEIDLWATNSPAFSWQAKQFGLPQLQVAYTIASSPLYLALNRETPDEVVKRLQTALFEMRTDGALQRFKEAYSAP